DFEIKNINISIVDHDHSTYSQKLVNKIIASGYFRMNDFSPTFSQSFQTVQTSFWKFRRILSEISCAKARVVCSLRSMQSTGRRLRWAVLTWPESFPVTTTRSGW